MKQNKNVEYKTSYKCIIYIMPLPIFIVSLESPLHTPLFTLFFAFLSLSYSVLAIAKRSRLLRTIVNYGHKSFITLNSRENCENDFFPILDHRRDGPSVHLRRRV